MKTLFAFTCAFLVSTLSLLSQDVSMATIGPKMTGKSADFTWKQGDKTISLSQFGKNKVIFLNFWGTWCGPCRKEIPDIIALQKEFPGTEFVVVGIALERDQDPVATVKSFMKKNNMDYQMVIGNQDITDAFGGITAVPTTFIIGKDFSVAEKLVGLKSKEEFVAAVKRAMAK